jgi:hypothetical protein
MHNPYWDAVKDHVTTQSRLWGEGPQVQRWDFSGHRFSIEGYPDREELTKKYSWTVTDPDSVEFVRYWSLVDGVIDPMAGTGYWAYLLRQVKVDIVCYDARPGDNPWHGSQHELHVPVKKLRAITSVPRYPDRTLLLAWPPYDDPAGSRSLSVYRGERVIYMGEGMGGCTGNDMMHRRLDRDFKLIDEHTPVTWEGLHDRITVYQRRRGREGGGGTAESALYPQ